MMCPSHDAESFQECVDCGGCRPGYPLRVGDFLEKIHLQEPDTTIVKEVVA